MTAKKGSIDIGKYKFIGEFKSESGAFRVADPCYTPDTWCLGVLARVAPGVWKAYVKTDPEEGRVARLLVIHETCVVDGVTSQLVLNKKLKADIGVDSGQAGFFDTTFNTWGRDGDDSAYEAICELTLDTPESAGVCELGAVSSSGYGDGSYVCRYATGSVTAKHSIAINDVVVAAEIRYI
jgi:hypothetical protein